MLLRSSEATLEELAATINFVNGVHMADRLMPAAPGIVVGEKPYESGRNNPSQINHNSVQGTATDTYFVQESIPEWPVSMTVIEHRDAREAETLTQGGSMLRDIWFGRQAMQKSLIETLSASLGDGDRVSHYIVGQPTEADRKDWDVEIIEDTDEPMAAAEAIEDLSAGELTLVLGSMRRLPLEKVPNGSYETLVAIKANHVYDRKLRPGLGVWLTGHPQMPDVDTDNPAQLARWNGYLKAVHERRIEQLEGAGIAVAPVVYDPLRKPSYLDVAATDLSINTALKIVEKKL